MLNWKGIRKLVPVPQIAQIVIALVNIYQLAKFGEIMSFGSKDIFKNAVLYTNTNHDVTDLVNMGWLKIQNPEYLENGT